MMMVKNSVLSLVAIALLACTATAGSRWTPEQAQAWSKKVGWLVGCNFTPSTAINQLEMWQTDTFDPATIDRELGWAEGIGMNSLRVFLHHVAWEQDPNGFLDRMDKFLELAHKHKIGVMFVFFDGCWDPMPRPGKQRTPRPHVHNSGWLQDPGREILSHPAQLDKLEPYVAAVFGRFAQDDRIHAWDLFNEPENENRISYGDQGQKLELPDKAARVQPLLEKVFAWARKAQPSQPLTVGVWKGRWDKPERWTPIQRLCLEQSDVISFHSYGPLNDMKRCVTDLRPYGRPILCTEFMARGNGSTFDPVLPYLRDQNVGAYCWGLVAGKTQTLYPWDSWQKQYTAEPPLWHHDIFRKDGTPFSKKEVEFIRRVTMPTAAGKPSHRGS